MIRVIKLGGSLLTLPEWHVRFLRWLATEPPAINVLLIGGGELVDVLRCEHERFPYDEKQMHYAALAAMEINAQLAHARLPQASLLNPNPSSVELPDAPSLVLVKVLDWWNSSAGNGNRLPEESWRITSDSIAGWLTLQVEAHELVLLKSTEPPPVQSDAERINTWAAHGYVDAAFPEWLGKKPCRAVNLRASIWDVL